MEDAQVPQNVRIVVVDLSTGVKVVIEEDIIEEPQESVTPLSPAPVEDSNTITLLFAGDIMAHSVNYVISDYPKIWRDVKYIIEPCDLAFANIEAPIDDTRKPHGSIIYFTSRQIFG